MSLIKEEGDNTRSQTNKHVVSVWIVRAFLMVSILLWAYIYYYIEAHSYYHKEYFSYYLVVLIGVLFWGFISRVKEDIRINTIVVTITIVLGVYLIEFGLNVLDLTKGIRLERQKVANELNVEYDNRTKLEVMKDFALRGKEVVPAVYPFSVLRNKDFLLKKALLPLGGIAKKTTVGGNESGYWANYQSDRYGFNNPDSEWDAEKVGFVLIGDSFVEGSEVYQGEDIAGRIRAITQKTVINLGKGSNGLLTELATLREYATPIKPSRVIWVYFEKNDLPVLQTESEFPSLMKYMDDGYNQNLINRQEEIDKLWEEYIELEQEQARKYQVESILFLPKIRDIIINSTAKEIQFTIKNSVLENPLFAKILVKAKTEVESWGGEFYFVYLPDYERYNSNNISHDHHWSKAKVIRIVKGLDIPIIDIHQEVFKSHYDPLSLFPFRLDGHYNPEGYAEVAKAIVKGVGK